MNQMSELDDSAAKRKRRKAFVANKVVPFAIIIVALLAAPIAFEQEMLSVSEGQVEVTVIGIQDDRPQGNRTPAWFRYNVSLSDGSRAVFISERVLQSGTRIVANVCRGRITGRVWLTGPYHLVGSPDQPSRPR